MSDSRTLSFVRVGWVALDTCIGSARSWLGISSRSEIMLSVICSTSFVLAAIHTYLSLHPSNPTLETLTFH